MVNCKILIIIFININFIQSILSESFLSNTESSESLSNILRPGQYVSSYNINITARENGFDGTAIIRVVIYNSQTRGNPIKFHFEDLTLRSVLVGVVNLNNPQPVYNLSVEKGILEITPPIVSSTYMFVIEYTASYRNDSVGLYQGFYNDRSTYLAMNLNPIHARKVFPCMDNPTEASEISVQFNCQSHRNIVGNSKNKGKPNEAIFASIYLPPHLWGMVAHNFLQKDFGGTNITLHARVEEQNTYAEIVSNSLLNLLNEWTNMPYFEIQRNQDENIHLLALPDMTREWYALSTISIWEPYILTKSDFSMRQRLLVLNAISEAFARQWFGYTIYPQNWKYSWITKGLSMTAAYEVVAESDYSLDMDGYFLTDVIHKSMLKDSFSTSEALEPCERLFSEKEILLYLNGIMQHKAAAIFRTLKLVVNKNEDIIQYIGRTLLRHRHLNHINTFHFFDAINSKWFFVEERLIDNVENFLDPYIHKPGYAIMNIFTRGGGVLLTQSLFSFTCDDNDDDEDENEDAHFDDKVIFKLPITYTTGNQADFDDIYPKLIMENTNLILNVDLRNEDWIIFNIQGQGYYRVNYDLVLWERLIIALNNENRINIHRLNRASLLDDVLNLARAGQQSYDIALQVVLTMQFELEYTPWRAFVQNMNFIKKHLLSSPAQDASDVYKRLIRYTLSSFEREIGFYSENLELEDHMMAKTRGLVMDHACRADYQPCLDAAHNWFYSDYNNTDINTDIPSDLRPAVYCSKVREGEYGVIELLWNLFMEEQSHYERVVILESFACSRDNEFITNLLEETLDVSGRFGMQERVLFFEAVADSHYENTITAFSFLRQNKNNIIVQYGGIETFNGIISKLSDNLVTEYLVESFETWILAINTDLGDAEESARLALSRAKENLIWREKYLEEVYEWIYNNIDDFPPTTEEVTTTTEEVTTEEVTTEEVTTEEVTTEEVTTEEVTTEEVTTEEVTTEEVTTEEVTTEEVTTEEVTTEEVTTEEVTTEEVTTEEVTTEEVTTEEVTTEEVTTEEVTTEEVTTEEVTTEEVTTEEVTTEEVTTEEVTTEEVTTEEVTTNTEEDADR